MLTGNGGNAAAAAANAVGGANGAPAAAGGGGGVGGAIQGAPSLMRTIMNAVMMYMLATNVINMFLPQQGNSANNKAADEAGGVRRTVGVDGEVQQHLPPYPAWPRGTMASLSFAFTFGNETDAPVVPMQGVKFASSVTGFRSPKKCPLSARFTKTESEEAEPDALMGPWRPATEGGAFGPVVFNYTDSDRDIFAAPDIEDLLKGAPSALSMDLPRLFRACRTDVITFNFTGLDMSEVVERNETVYLRVSIKPLSLMVTGATKYFQMTHFRHRPPPKPRHNLLESAASQSPRYMLDAPKSNASAATDEDGDVESTRDTTTEGVERALDAVDGNKATAGAEAGGKTRMYMPPTMPIVIAPMWNPVDQLPPPIQEQFQRTPDGVPPLVHHHDFWILKSRLTEVNASTAKTVADNFTVSVDTLEFTRALMYVMYEQQYQSQVAMGLASPEDGDVLRSILLDNNPWYLALCVFVSLLRMVFETLAFKNDVQFWKGKKDLRGLSLRTVAINCYFQVVIFLYLLDDGNTSWAVTLPMAVGVIIEFWKLFQCIKLRRDPETQRVVGFEWNWQEEDETSAHDRQAMRYMMIVGAPCLALYTLYSLAYEEHAGWYSFIIRTQVRFIYYAGFAMMCPQIFINYKLKSVAAMPWKSFVYKALNTVVDDLFAFVITMPLLHRLACFRDDVVFVVLLYQRWVYAVDPTRVNEFGQRGDGKAPDAEEGAIREASPTPSITDTPAASSVASPADSKAASPAPAAAEAKSELKQRKGKGKAAASPAAAGAASETPKPSVEPTAEANADKPKTE